MWQYCCEISSVLVTYLTFLFIKAPLAPWLLLGSPMLMDPHPSQQHAGLHHAVWQLQVRVLFSANIGETSCSWVTFSLINLWERTLVWVRIFIFHILTFKVLRSGALTRPTSKLKPCVIQQIIISQILPDCPYLNLWPSFLAAMPFCRLFSSNFEAF